MTQYQSAVCSSCLARAHEDHRSGRGGGDARACCSVRSASPAYPHELSCHTSLTHELQTKRTEIRRLSVRLTRPEGLQALAIVSGRELLQAWIDFLCKQPHRGDRLGIRQETCLGHHQQMAESASVFPKIFDLCHHLIWSTGKDIAAGHLLVKPGYQRDTGPTTRAFHDLGRYGWRMIARRVAPMRRHLVGRHIPEKFFRPCPGLLRGIAYVDQSGVGQPIERCLLTMGRAVGGTIAVVDLANARVTS